MSYSKPSTQLIDDVKGLSVTDSDSDKENMDPQYTRYYRRRSDMIQRVQNIPTTQLYLEDTNYYCLKYKENAGYSVRVGDDMKGILEQDREMWDMEDDQDEDLNIIVSTSDVVKFLVGLDAKYSIEHVHSPPQIPERGVVVIQCIKYIVGEWQLDLKGDASMLPQVMEELLATQMELSSTIRLSGPIGAYMKLSTVRIRRIESGVMGSVYPIQPSDYFSLQALVRDFCNLKAGKPLTKSIAHSPPLMSVRLKQRPLRNLTNVCDWDAEISRVLTYQQREVSCIIGRQGQRLNSIRDSSGCTIKVLPVDTTSTISLSLPRKSIPQSISLTGTRPQVNMAIAAINHCILQYRESDAKFI